MNLYDRWLLPAGIEESLPDEAFALEQMRRQLLDMFASWGYELVIPPFIEFLESLLITKDGDLGLQTLKLTDQLSGRLMGVRADMTPQVARIDADRLKREHPTRLCYLGTVLQARPEHAGGTRSPLQVGAELYGHAGVESDTEIINLMLESLRVTGVEDFVLDLGHVGIFRALVNQAGLNAEQQKRLLELLQSKADSEVNAFLQTLSLEPAISAALSSITSLYGNRDVLATARTHLSSVCPEAVNAINYIEQVADALLMAWPTLSIHYDLAEPQGYEYQNGIVFAAYKAGVGQALARGGRYDSIGQSFGRARPATGFSADLKTLMRVAGTPRPNKKSAIFAPLSCDSALADAIRRLRTQGEVVIQALSIEPNEATDVGCDRELVYNNNKWTVREISDE